MRAPDDSVALSPVKDDLVSTVPDRKAMVVASDDVVVRCPFDDSEAQRFR